MTDYKSTKLRHRIKETEMKTFYINLSEVTGQAALEHFMQWALSIGQENRWPSGITALCAMEIYVHAVQNNDPECVAHVLASGIGWADWKKIA